MIRVLHGTDTFRSLRRLRDLRHDFLLQSPQAVVTRLALSDSALVQALATPSLFAIPQLLVAVASSDEPAQIPEPLLGLLAGIDPATELIIWAADIAQEQITILTQIPQLQVERFEPLRGEALSRYLHEVAGAIGPQLSAAQVDWLWRRSQQDLWAFESNLAKLASLPQPFDRNQIDWLIPMTPDESDFALTDAILSGDLRSAQQILQHELDRSVDTQRLVGGLAAQLRSLIRVHDIAAQSPGSPASIANQTKLHPYMVGKLLSYRGASLADLRALYVVLADLDWGIKTGAIASDDALNYFLGRLDLATSPIA